MEAVATEEVAMAMEAVRMVAVPSVAFSEAVVRAAEVATMVACEETAGKPACTCCS